MTLDRPPPLPNFLIIGAQKSATRWLRMNLGKHPDIYTAPRELAFFNHGFEKGVKEYRDHFVEWDGEEFIGEATPGYREDPDLIATRIDEVLPDGRLIALLRNPVDRAYSAFIHHMGKGRIDPGADLLRTISAIPPEDDRKSLIAGGWYGASLEPYARRFGDRLLVLLHDDVGVEPESVYTRAVRHIGASDGYLPPALSTVRFSAAVPPASAYADAGGRRRLAAEERLVLYRYFADDIAKLEELLGIDLDRWRL